MRNFKGTFFLCILLAASSLGFSQATRTSNGTGGGAWSAGATWVGGTPPSNGDRIIIQSGDAVNVDVNQSIQWIEIWGDLTIDASKTLTVAGCNQGNSFFQDFTVDAFGTLTNNGTLDLNQGACGGFPIYEDQGTFTNNGLVLMDLDANYTESGSLANTGTITVNSTSGGSTFINFSSIDNTGGVFNFSSGATMTNYGSFIADGTINMNAGSTYQHVQNGGTVPTCTWNAASTCEIQGGSPFNIVPSGLSQSFGHFTWNSTGQSTTLSLEGNLTSIAGNFNFLNAGTSRILRLATTQSPTINVSGNLIMNTNGVDQLQFATTGTAKVNVGGSVTINSGRIVMGASSTPSSPELNVTGDYTHSASSSASTLSLSGQSGVSGVLNVGGNFNYTSSLDNLITETSTGSGAVNFVGDATHLFNSVTSLPIHFRQIAVHVTANDVLDMSASTSSVWDFVFSSGGIPTFTVSGTLITGTKTISMGASTSFVLASGATLNTANTSGVNATITGTGTRTFNSAANYILTGATTTTGFTGANTTMNNLGLGGSATLGESIVVNGTLLNSTGTFTAGSFTVDVNGDLTNNSTITGGTSTFSVAGTFTNAGTFNAGSGNLYAQGNFVNNGTFTHSTGTVTCNGSAAQTIGGSTKPTFNDLVISNTAGVSLVAGVDLYNVLTITDGTFTTTGQNFTIKSNASGTGAIAEIPAGRNIVGDIIMERYTGSGPTDWRFLGSPVSNATIADWADDLPTSGFTGATCGPTDCGIPGCVATCTWVSIYTYDETQYGDLETGYVEATNVTNTLDPGVGFWVYVGTNPFTYEVSGTPNTFAQSLPVWYTAQYSDDDDGWNMVSNPYPCTIDWDDASWTKDDMEDAVYIFNSSTGTYASYIAGAGTNGGSNFIASQQAFWVKANSDLIGPNLGAVEAVKQHTVDPTFLRTKPEVNTSDYPMAFKDYPVPQNATSAAGDLRLVAKRNGYADEIMIRFKQGGSSNFDSQYDAWDLANPNYSAPNFSSVINDTSDLSINTYAPLGTDVTIPIRLKVPVTGTYTISRDPVLMLPMSSCVYLEDTKVPTTVDLRTIQNYTFTISDTTVFPRFKLHIYAPITKSSESVSCAGGNNGKAIARGIGSGPWNYTWKDGLGITIKTSLNKSTADTLYNAAPGTYSVTVDGAICGSVTDTITILAPAVLQDVATVNHLNCFGDGNVGSIDLNPTGGSPSYTYSWSTGATTNGVSNLAPGDYTVTLSDASGCTSTYTYSVNEPTNISSSITSYAISCFGGSNGTASAIVSGGSGGYTYSWSNGQSVATAQGLTAGDYTLTVTDMKGCIANATTTVAQASALTTTSTVANISCFGANDGSVTLSVSGGTPGYSYFWDNGQYSANLSGLTAGAYEVLVQDANGCNTTYSVSIMEPALLTASASVTAASCYNSADGSAIITPAGGTGAYTFSWSSGQTSSAVNNLLAGSYTVTISDLNGCSSTASFAISQPSALIASFVQNPDTADLTVSGNVLFANTSTGAISYQWDFGDNSGIDINVNPTHTYTATGTYTVMLVSSDGNCFDTAYKVVVVVNSNPTSVNNSNYEQSIQLTYGTDNQFYLQFKFDEPTQLNIEILNAIGKIVWKQEGLIVENEHVKLDMSKAATGFYIAVTELQNDRVVRKFILPSNR